MPKPLTLQLIQQKVKNDSVGQVKNLNLWGNELDDLSVLEYVPNLEVLSLSVNAISTLRDIAKCAKLQELYLRKNNINDINEVIYLQKLKNLRVLWLSGTYFMFLNYRQWCCEPPLLQAADDPVLPELGKVGQLAGDRGGQDVGSPDQHRQNSTTRTLPRVLIPGAGEAALPELLTSCRE